MDITYFGHSAFLVKLDGGTLLFDPFISENPLSKDKVDLADVKADVILLSHGHWDHVGDTVALAKQNDAPVVAIVETAAWLEKQGVKTRELNLGGKIDLGFATVRAVPAWHTSSLPDGTYGGTAAGFVVTHKHGTFYFSGDTALSLEMQLIGARYKPDIAFLCMGDLYTMDVEDAAHAAQLLGVKNVIGMHYDTWPPIHLSKDKAHDIFRQLEIPLHLLPLHNPVKL
jgi:L-ascorbate metabolism protein UlaG (beta-lactamase superfamily)